MNFVNKIRMSETELPPPWLSADRKKEQKAEIKKKKIIIKHKQNNNNFNKRV